MIMVSRCEFIVNTNLKGRLEFYENIGTSNSPKFVNQTGSANDPFYGISFNQDLIPAFADIDGDGDLDLFVGSDSPGIHYFRNRRVEDGVAFDTFATSGTANEQTGPWDPVAKTGNPFNGIGTGLSYHISVSFVNLDGDGDLDAFIGHAYSYPGDGQSVHYFENDGSGIFTPDPPTAITPGVYPFGTITPSSGTGITTYRLDPQFADLDEDGDLDLITGDRFGYIRFFANDGSNNFNEQTGPWTPGNPSTGNPFDGFSKPSYMSITLADLDGDGDIDAAAGYSNSQVPLAYFRNDGQGEFTEIKELLSPFDGITDVESIAAIELDSNFPGPEIVIDPTASGHRYYRSNDEVYIAESSNPFSSLSLGYESTTILLDFDNDGDADLISGQSGGSIRYFKNDPAGTYTELTSTANPFNSIYVGQEAVPALVDIDADTDLDLFIGNKYGNIVFYRNDGTSSSPSFAQQIGASNPLNLIDTYDLVTDRAEINFQDLDNDGDYDLFLSGKYDFMGTPEIMYFENTGSSASPVFANPPGASPFTDAGIIGNYDYSLNFIDFDNDGDLDVFSASEDRNYEVQYFQNQNPSPVVVAPAELTFAPYVPFTLFPALTLSDSDNDLIFKVTISLSPFEIDNEVLDATGLPVGILAVFDDIDGVLTLTGPASLADFQDALRLVTYLYDDSGSSGLRLGGSSAGKTINRTISLQVFDSDGTLTTDNSKLISLTHSNNVPAITPASQSLTYTGSAITLSSALNATDGDDPSFISCEVIISSGYQAGEDELLFTPIAGITATFDPSTGTLTLSGTAPIADYITLLRSVQYNNLNSTPTTTNRNIRFKVNDGTNDSNLASVTVSFPTSTPGISSSVTALTYPGSTTVIDNAFTIADSDSPTLASAAISITSGLVSAEDNLLFTNTGTITGSYNSSTGVLALTGPATLAEFEAALESIQYQNNLASPTKQDRAISFTVSDGTNTSNAHTVTISFPNSAPVLTPATASQTFAGSDLALNGTLAITDDDANLSSATVSIAFGFRTGEDELVFTDQNGITGSFDSITGILTLTGVSSVANYQTALRSVLYRNTAADRTNADRIIEFRVNDGLASSNMSQVTVSVPNVPPSLSSSTISQDYSGGNLVLDNNLSIGDNDDVNISSAAVSITSGFVSGEDELVFVDQNGIAGSFNSTAGVLSLSGSATLTNYQTALRSVEYRNVASNRTPGDRTISFLVNDGQIGSNSLSIAVVVPNTAPSISAATESPFYGNSDVVINGSIALSDLDNGDLQSATVTITTGYQSTEDQLVFTTQNGITGNFNSTTGVLSLTGSSSVANYEAALRSVQYRNTSTAPNTSDRTVTFSVSDGNNSSPVITTTITINKPPVINAEPQTTEAGGQVSFNIASLFSDPDNNLDLNTITIVSAEGADVTIVDGEIVVDYSGVSDFDGTDTLTITICDQAGSCRTEVINIDVESELKVFSAVSPNGDGANDFFKIMFLPAGSKVSIYNRWGDLVFDMDDYNSNDPEKRFNGLNNNGNEVASGTYFYKINLTDGRELKGYLVLKR